MAQRMEEQITTHVATLLVVEDDPDIQMTLQQLFMLQSYHVLTAESGIQAIELLEHEPIDLVVLDVMLPDMNGYEVCKYMRQNDVSHTPIIMLTALTHQPNVTMGLEIGADDYVKKPFAPDELLLRVKRLLQRHDERRAAEQETSHLRDMLELTQRQLQVSQNETAVEATLRREFLHNVATHMQALSGIVEAASRKVSPGPDREVVQQLKSRVRSAALVYEISEVLQDDPVEIGGLITTIASALKNVYRPWRRVLLNISNEPLTMPLTIASPLAMIVNELVTNCFKHAFPDNRFGKVEISYAMRNDAFTLDIVDDGVGFDVEQAAPGRGRITVAQLVYSLQGAADWQSSASGTRVHITLPLS